MVCPSTSVLPAIHGVGVLVFAAITDIHTSTYWYQYSILLVRTVRYILYLILVHQHHNALRYEYRTVLVPCTSTGTNQYDVSSMIGSAIGNENPGWYQYWSVLVRTVGVVYYTSSTRTRMTKIQHPIQHHDPSSNNISIIITTHNTTIRARTSMSTYRTWSIIQRNTTYHN